VSIKRIEITVESYEALVIRQSGSLARSYCSSCRRRVAVISFSDVTLSGLSPDAIHQQEKAGRLHLVETIGGLRLICLNSLIQILKEMSR
jgi:hypothetical protein